MTDPLGYDTKDLRAMARDALEGRNEEDVDAEAARLRQALGLPPHRLRRWTRAKRWLSHRWWRMRFWIRDRL